MGVRLSNPGDKIMYIGNAQPGVRLSGAGASYDADAATLFAAMSSQPDATRKALINTTILALKAAGIWTLLDELWSMAAHDSQAGLLGWKRYKDLTAVNAPTFTTDQGFAGNGTTSYLNTGYVPSTDGVQYTQNDASLGAYLRTNSAADSHDFSVEDSGKYATIAAKWSDNTAICRANQSASGSLVVANADSRGLLVARRTGSTTSQLYRNGSSITTTTQASTARPARALYIGAINANGTPIQFSTRQYAMAFVGASMTAQQQLDLFTITEAYLDAIGAGVI